MSNREDRLHDEAVLIAAYKRTFLTPDGTMILEDLCSKGMMDVTTADPNPYLSYLSQGKREMALYILGQLNMSVHELLTNSVEQESL